MRIAYVMSRFPKLTETFILGEILAMRRLGVDVTIYPLLRERDRLVQPEAVDLVAGARYQPFLSWPILGSQLGWLATHPIRYLRTLAEVMVATLGSRNFFFGALAIFPKVAHVARLMQREGIDHVHCHFANHPATAGLMIHRLTGIPFSFTAHGSDLHRDRTGLPAKVRAASFVVAISEDNRSVIRRTVGEATSRRVEVIHCGVDVEQLRPPATRERDGVLRIVAVGTLHEVKGQAFLLDACRLLAERGIEFECRIIGDGEDRAMLEGRIRAHRLEDRVVLAGRQTGDAIGEELRAASVLVTPSVPSRDGRREGIPVVLMEAMATGLPVVASRLSGIPELVEHEVTGLLAEPRDAEGLADALLALYGDDVLAARLGAAGRERVVRDFNVERNAARLAERIRSALAAAPPASGTPQ